GSLYHPYPGAIFGYIFRAVTFPYRVDTWNGNNAGFLIGCFTKRFSDNFGCHQRTCSIMYADKGFRYIVSLLQNKIHTPFHTLKTGIATVHHMMRHIKAIRPAQFLPVSIHFRMDNDHNFQLFTTYGELANSMHQYRFAS